MSVRAKSKSKGLNNVAFLIRVEREANRATEQYGEFNSDHEAWGVLAEEVDELWEWVRRKKAKRNIAKMTAELVQVAAACAKWAQKLNREAEEAS